MSGQPKGRADLLVELGTEELPPSVLKQLGEQFATLLTDALVDTGLGCEGPMSWFATARRLAVRVPGVAHRCADQINERRGPALAAAFDDQGQPTPAATGFLWRNRRSAGKAGKRQGPMAGTSGARTWGARALSYRALYPECH